MKRTAIITGASGNLGSAAVNIFLKQQYRVIAVGNRAEQPFPQQPGDLEYHQVNLAREAEATSLVESVISQYGTIHAGLLLAGGFEMGGIDSTGEEALKKMYAINFETAYYTARSLFSHMIKQGYGRLVFVGARPALLPGQGKNMIAYALSKSLVFRLSEHLNEEAKGVNVVSSVVVPSTIDTPQNRKSMPDSDTSKWVKAGEIAELIEFICSEKASSIREPVYKLYNNA